MFGVSKEFVDQFNLIAKQVAEIHAVICKETALEVPAGEKTGGNAVTGVKK